MLQTKRLIISEMTFEDEEGFFDMCSDEETAYSAGWKPHPNIEVTRHLITCFMYDKDTYSIRLKKNNEFIGTISLYKNDKRDSISRELGFCLDKNYRKKGYMLEAVEEIIKYAFDILNIDILVVECATFNTDCETLIKKLPFKYEGCIRKSRKLFNQIMCDIQSYSLLKEEYEEEIK